MVAVMRTAATACGMVAGDSNGGGTVCKREIVVVWVHEQRRCGLEVLCTGSSSIFIFFSSLLLCFLFFFLFCYGQRARGEVGTAAAVLGGGAGHEDRRSREHGQRIKELGTA
jgi:hypothetical protein